MSFDELIRQYADNYLRENLTNNNLSIIQFIRSIEKDTISFALKINNVDIQKTADLLGLTYWNLLKKIKRRGIDLDKRVYLQNRIPED